MLVRLCTKIPYTSSRVSEEEMDAKKGLYKIRPLLLCIHNPHTSLCVGEGEMKAKKELYTRVAFFTHSPHTSLWLCEGKMEGRREGVLKRPTHLVEAEEPFGEATVAGERSSSFTIRR